MLQTELIQVGKPSWVLAHKYPTFTNVVKGIKNSKRWISHTKKKAPTFTPIQFGQMMTKMSNERNNELRAKVALILAVECDMRPSDIHNIFSCDAKDFADNKGPVFVLGLPNSKNNAEGTAGNANVVVCSCDAEVFKNTKFDADCSYHVLKLYKDKIPDPNSKSLLFLRGLTNSNGFKRYNCGIQTIYK